jgi:GNAT superfamily N-acetyltransferase
VSAMGERILDVDLENLHRVPRACLEAVFWERPDPARGVDPRLEKREWFAATLLEWGPCAKLVLLDEEGVAFAQFAPATLFPTLRRFPAASAASPDAVYLAYCFADEHHRGRGLGGRLIGEVARHLVERGYRAVEALGDRAGESAWVLPFGFLAASGFLVARDDERFPLLRLDLLEAGRPSAHRSARSTPGSVPPAAD